MEKNRNLLVVDDEPLVTKSLERVFRKSDYHLFIANSAIEALAIMDEHDIGVIMSDMNMPGVDGLSLFAIIKKKKPDVIQIIITGNPTMDNSISAINKLQLFGYLTKPWDDGELKFVVSRAFDSYNLICDNKKLHQLTQKQNKQLKDMNHILEEKVRERTCLLEDAISEGVLMLAKAAEAKDQETGDHVNRIMYLTRDICVKLDIPGEITAQVVSFSRIHDVGKIHIPDHILNKPGPLDDDEWAIMKNHTVAGDAIISDFVFYKIAKEIARSHHENWDGTGYPDGLSGEVIPISARIVAVADVYDALINKRPYKKAWEQKDAIAEMESMSGRKFDPEVLDAFLSVLKKK